MEFLPLWPTYIAEKGRTLGLKRGAIGNTLEEHIGKLGTYWNLMGTHWKLERNMLGTKEKRKKKPPSQT